MPTVSSNRIFPKESFIAWEVWNPGALPGDPTPGATHPLETEEARSSNAYATGYEEGQRAGYLAGLAEGRAAGTADAATLHHVAAAATQALQSLGDTLSHKTVALAAAIAQKMLQREIETHPDSIIAVVREALTLLPDAIGRARLVVHADDLELVRRYLDDNTGAGMVTCAVMSSPDMTKGGCMITAPSGDINATLETRWGRLMTALGQTLGEPHGPGDAR